MRGADNDQHRGFADLEVAKPVNHRETPDREFLAHFRDDFPAKDEAFGKFNIVVGKGAEGEVQLTREPIPPMPAELQEIIQEMK